MKLHMVSDLAKCRVVAVTLSNEAKKWFRSFKKMAMECWECSCSHLLFNVSLISALLPNLLNTFLVVLLSWLLPVRIFLGHPIVLFDSGRWERGTSALGSTPVLWVLTTIRFLPVHCEATTCCPLVASSRLMLVDTKPCGEHSSSLAGFSSRCTGWFHYGIGCCGACISRFCVMWLIMASTGIGSMFCSTLFSRLAYSFTSSMAKCHLLWVCSFAAADVSDTCWLVLAMFFLEVKLATFKKQYFC